MPGESETMIRRVAFLALPPTGEIDVSHIRSNPKAAQTAAVGATGATWKTLAGYRGWRVISVHVEIAP